MFLAAGQYADARALFEEVLEEDEDDLERGERQERKPDLWIRE
jgi:hypothetical protein